MPASMAVITTNKGRHTEPENRMGKIALWVKSPAAMSDHQNPRGRQREPTPANCHLMISESKHKDSWIPRTHAKGSRQHCFVCNLNAREAETGGFPGLAGQLAQPIGEPQVQRDFVS